MRSILLSIALMLTIVAGAQTLNVTTSSGTTSYSAANLTSSSPVTFSNGTTMTVGTDTYTISDITGMSVSTSSSTDVDANTVKIVYNGTTATVTAASNIAQYVTPTVSGAHVSIVQSDDLAEEITYTLSGTSTDGEFYMSGSYKATLELNGLTLSNTTPVYSGAAIHVQNGKRIKVKLVAGTSNTLVDAADGSQKGCLYIKGHAEFAQKGTLNVVGNVKHGIKTGEYFTIKNATINITSSVGDGINCGQFFLMESGAITISGTQDDGIQCDIDDTETYPTGTGETTDHEDEDSGNIYIEGGTLNITVTADAAKGIKSEGDLRINNGDITVETSGGGVWDSDKVKTKASACLGADGNITINGGTQNLTSTGAGGKGINGDGTFTATGGTVVIKTSGNAVVASSSGTLSTVSNSSQLDRYDSDYKSSPKGIKIDGAIVISDQAVISVTTTGAGGEGIESKTTIDITGGQVTVNASDDAINASYNDDTKSLSNAGNMTISGGYVYARSTGNDGIDANGNVYIKGGLVYAVGSSSPEVAIDANSEEQKKLYVQGGTLIAIGGLESGASLTQTCYSTSSWSKDTWYAMTVGSETFAFKTPTSGGNTMVVSGASQPSLKSGVTVSSGTSIFDGVGYTDASVTGGTTVNLSAYSGGNGGGPGGNPGGGGPGWQ